MLLRDILTEQVTTYDLSGMKQQLGVSWVDMESTFTYDELANLAKQGINVPKLGKEYVEGKGRKVPTIYTHVVHQKDNEGLLHAIKMRDPQHVMKTDLVHQMIHDSVTAILGTEDIKHKDRAWETVEKSRALEVSRKSFKVYKPTIIPMPSSSPLTMMFATELGHQSGCPVSNILMKHPYPEMSKMVRTKSRGFEPLTNPVRSPAERYRENVEKLQNKLYPELAKWQKAYDEADTEAAMFRAEHNIQQLKAEIAKLETATNPAASKWEKKSKQSAMGTSRLFYDYIRPKEGEDITKFHQQHIVLVDDNIVTGETLAEAVKSFVRRGVIPIIDTCICIHHYI